MSELLTPPQTATSAVAEEDFALDLRVVTAVRPSRRLSLNTDDGCGSSCGGACVSFVEDPS